MLLDDDVVANGKAKARALSGGLGREEWVEHLFLHVGRDAGAVVADRDFDSITEVSSDCRESGLIATAVSLRPAFGRSVKTIGNQIEQNPRDVLRKDIGLTGSRI